MIINVWIGLMLGSTAKTVSPTRPRDVEATPSELRAKLVPVALTSTSQKMRTCYQRDNQIKTCVHLSKTRSTAVTRAHAFGAQYAWFKPRLKGKRRLASCGSCPIKRNGPMETTKTAITIFARERNLFGRMFPVTSSQ